MDPAATGAGLPSFWQLGAALVTVLALLVLALKLLGRLQNNGNGQDRVRLLKVRRLGPKRELETLRLDDEVFTIYRHDGGMVVLRREPESVHAGREPEVTPTATAVEIGRKLKALACAAGAGARPSTDA